MSDKPSKNYNAMRLNDGNIEFPQQQNKAEENEPIVQSAEFLDLEPTSELEKPPLFPDNDGPDLPETTEYCEVIINFNILLLCLDQRISIATYSTS